MEKKNIFPINEKEQENSCSLPVWENETDRQLYYMQKAGEHVAALKKELGRTPTCCVVTFGCPTV